MPLSTLASLGEFGLIDLFRSCSAPSGLAAGTLGIGDDCAVLPTGGDERLLVTKDLLVEGSHFVLGTLTPQQLGYKALAVNISDVAAMGGEPTAAFLGLGLPAATSLDWVRGFRDGLRACAEEHGVALLGGDTVAVQRDLVLSITLLGRTRAGQLLLRSGGRPGDRVLVGGPLGDSAAGLQLLLGGGEVGEGLPPAHRERLIDAHLRPQPQVALGRLLALEGLAHAALDVSDGLLQDLGHLCAASGVGALVDADSLPISDAALGLGRLLSGSDPAQWALSGGEDYCLLFAVPPEALDPTLRRCAEVLGAAPTVVGELTEGLGMRLRSAGRTEVVRTRGHDHFAAPR